MRARTLALILLSMAGLFAIDKFLARMEVSEVHAEAARIFKEGQGFAADGQTAQAIDRFRAAVAASRDNREYRLALANSLLAAGKTPEAETVLSDVLAASENDGLANLAMARVMLRKGNVPEAISYYHRAIYGHWATGQNVLPVRLELIDLLDRQDRKRELLAELLPVQEEMSASPDLRLRLAQLYLRAGSPSRAAAVFRGILAVQPHSAEVRAGLAEAVALIRAQAAQ